MRRFKVGTVIASCFFSWIAEATTVAFTGSELVGSPAVSFPSQPPTVSGSSIVFGPDTQAPFTKLVMIDLGNLGLVSTTDPIEVSVVANLTRLGCDEAPGRCLGGTTDWDPEVLLLDDAHHLFGVALGDPNPAPHIIAAEVNDLSNPPERKVFQTISTPDMFPGIGESVELKVHFSLSEDHSTFTASALGETVNYDAKQLLQRPGDMRLVLLRDNDPGEQYQVNSISISTPSAIPEPSVVAALLVGIVGLALFRRRQSGRHSVAS